MTTPNSSRPVRDALIVIAAVVLGALRVVGVKHPAFQATAHFYVGFLFGVWAATKEMGRPDRLCFWTAIALSAVELACFLVSHGP